MKAAKKPDADDPIKKADEALRRSRIVTNKVFEENLNPDMTPKKPEKGKFANAMDDIWLYASTIHGIKTGFSWINEKAIQPVLSLPYVGPVISSPFKHTFRAYYRYTHPYEGETAWGSVKQGAKNIFGRRGNAFLNLFRKEKRPYAPDMRKRGPLSKTRAGVALFLSTWAITAMMNVPIAGDSFRYLITEPAVDGARMGVTLVFNGVTGKGFGLTRDTLYYGVPSKETGDDIYHVTASTHQNSNEDNSVSFEVRDRLLHEIWSFANGHGPFRPDYVVGPIRPDSNMCETVSYGSRFRIARWASFRPDLLSVSCTAPGELVPAGKQ